MKIQNKSVKFQNPRTGEIWICPNINQKKLVEGVTFIEVHKPENSRLVWINSENLVKFKKNMFSK